MAPGVSGGSVVECPVGRSSFGLLFVAIARSSVGWATPLGPSPAVVGWAAVGGELGLDGSDVSPGWPLIEPLLHLGRRCVDHGDRAAVDAFGVAGVDFDDRGLLVGSL